ncbi:uncharacterized protein LOC116771260 isoform X1 [Danaus plexippus]|uniref:uncharacterized protein LOC116771260 isoform X1 n=1 Tax=Danaus plexippus TaxID=13037 RepID=UPI000239BA9B|nr:uncharacterized protein LOC116771260 isoform X1 [Danaus plexippus]
MCLAKEESQSPQKEVQSPRSPWMKLLNRQSSKPRLPRKVTSSTRVNLNKCWSKLGELISNSPPRSDLPSHKTAYIEEPIIVPFSEYFYPIDPVKPLPVEDNDNAENQNILNSSRFELISGEEISDNVANEVREICYTAKTSCFVCKLCY